MTATPTVDVVGRDAELAAVRALFESTELPAALVLEGEPGIGKTTLWRAGLTLAGERGFGVLSCAPAEAERALAYSGLADLLAEIEDELLDVLPEPQARALRIALLRASADATPPPERAIAAAVAALLSGLAARGPVLVAVDDAQWLDAPSSAVVAYAVRRLGTAPLAVLATLRSGQDEPFSLDRGLGERAARMQLGPLSLGALHRVLRRRMHRSLPRPRLRRLHAIARGNPLYALELVRAGADRVDLEQLAVPPSLRRLVADRVDRLPDETREALAFAALALQPTVDLLARALGRPPLLEPAISAEVVEVTNGRVRFAHPLLAPALSERRDPEARRACHLRLAEAATGVEERARHLGRAHERANAAAAAALESAAESATARGAPGVALDLLEEAVRLTPAEDEDGWMRRALAASRAARAGGDFARGSAFAEAAVDRLPPGERRAEAVLELVRCSSAPAAEVAEAAVAEAGSNEALRARLWLMVSDHRFLDDLPGSVAASESGLRAAEAAGDDELVCEALTLLGFAEAARGTGEPVERFERAISLVRPEEVPVYFAPAANLAVVRMWRDELPVARRLLRDEFARAGREGDEFSTGWTLNHLAQLEWRAGNLDAAFAYAEEALSLLEQVGDEHARSTALWMNAVVHAYAGRLDEARTAAEAGLALKLADRLFPARQHAVLGFVAFCDDDHASAQAHFVETRRLLDEYGVGEPGLVLYAGEEIEALVRLGRLDEAARCVERLRKQGERLDRPRLLALAARGEGLLLTERGLVAPARDAFDRALAEHERFEAAFERARTLLAFGLASRRARRQADARQQLNAAAETFAGVGSPLWEQRALGELQRVAGRTSESGLTPTEQRVAELVGEGRTNKEVAGALFVSVKAVEANLSRVYAKLGVRSRSELAARIAARKL
jgi:DNA-binding CsgD family transcriptional regulator